MTSRDLRNRAFGQDYSPTAVDRFGIWLSSRRIRSSVGSFAGRDVADVGCGYHATLARSILDDVATMALVDLAISDDLKTHPRVRVIEAPLPEAMLSLADACLDVVICNSVLEHLWEPIETVEQFWRALRPGGTAVINVPSWRGKRFLEFSAFRLGTSPADEMQDHKAYYDPRDLWPILIRAGFLPRDISCYTHKFGLNTFAVCRKPANESSTMNSRRRRPVGGRG